MTATIILPDRRRPRPARSGGLALTLLGLAAACRDDASGADRHGAVLVLGEDDSRGSGFAFCTERAPQRPVAPDRPERRCYIATARHVVEASTTVWVEATMESDDGEYPIRLPAEVVYSSVDDDLALLELDPGVPDELIPPLDLADPDPAPSARLLVRGYTMDHVVGEPTGMKEVTATVQNWGKPIALPDVLRGTIDRTTIGISATAPEAAPGISGAGALDPVTKEVKGYVVTGNDATGEIGIVAVAAIHDALAAIAKPATPTPAPTREELDEARRRLDAAVRTAWTDVVALGAAPPEQQVVTLGRVLPLPTSYVAPSDLRVARATLERAEIDGQSREGLFMERMWLWEQATWTLEHDPDAAAPPAFDEVRTLGDGTVEADVVTVAGRRSYCFRREHGRWYLSVRACDGQPYFWTELARHAASWSGSWRALDATYWATLEIVPRFARVAARLAVGTSDGSCEYPLETTVSAVEETLRLRAATTEGCPVLRAVVLERTTPARLSLVFDTTTIELDAFPAAAARSSEL
jgi:hypothetical protein